MFWRKKKEDVQNSKTKIILGMIMLADDDGFKTNDFIVDYERSYNQQIIDTGGNNSSFVFSVDGQQVLIGYMPLPIPQGDIEGTAQYAYNWKSVLADVKDHKSHLIVSIVNEDDNQIKCYRLFTRIICSLLRVSNSIGVYKGNQSLLIHKEDYLEEAGFMSADYLPLNLWIYFGLRVADSKNAGYTYGLKEFDKTEMEIMRSDKSMTQFREYLFNMSHYVLENNIEFKSGQTCGTSPEERIQIVLSKGKFVEGETFKMGY